MKLVKMVQFLKRTSVASGKVQKKRIILNGDFLDAKNVRYMKQTFYAEYRWALKRTETLEIGNRAQVCC